MSDRNQEIIQKLSEARLDLVAVIEDLGTVLMHLREGIRDAEISSAECAELSASDALNVLSEIETAITNIQDKVALCTS